MVYPEERKGGEMMPASPRSGYSIKQKAAEGGKTGENKGREGEKNFTSLSTHVE